MYLDRTLQQYLDDLASAQPTPGGGSASALTGAMGASLACMVARLTVGKADYTAVQQEIGDLIEQGEGLRARFQELMRLDIEAYGKLSSCFKMPRGTSEEKEERKQAVQGALVEAALVPLEMVERALELVRCCKRVAEIGNKNVLSDIATATSLALATGNGAAWMVNVNITSLKDADKAQELQGRLDGALGQITEEALAVNRAIEERGTK